MAVKRAAAKKAMGKKRATLKAVDRAKPKAGDAYTCQVCGLSVVVDEDCGCEEVHDILCCSKPMKKKQGGK